MAAWVKLLVFGGIFYHLYNQVRVLASTLAKKSVAASLLAVLAASSTTSANRVRFVRTPRFPASNRSSVFTLALLPPRQASYMVLDQGISPVTFSGGQPSLV